MVASYVRAARGSPPTVATHEGGLAHPIDIWAQLNRFLILGSAGGTYYVGEQELGEQAVQIVETCLAEDGMRTVRTIVEVSDSGRAPKNEPAILALAQASLKEQPQPVRAFAFSSLPAVCRTGTHLLHFVAYREALGGGWGRAMKRAIVAWFEDRGLEKATYQALKYPSRDGWSQRDLLRLSHPPMTKGTWDLWARWVVGKTEFSHVSAPTGEWWIDQLWAHDQIHAHTNTDPLYDMIRTYKLPREALPTETLNDRIVWEALLDDMPMMAMVRNLGKMTSIGLIAHNSDAEGHVVSQLANKDAIRKSRMHPLSFLIAAKTYDLGHGIKGSLTWKPTRAVSRALDEAFYTAFGNVQPTNKHIRLSIDVSGSMESRALGSEVLTNAEVAAAMALVTESIEPNAHVMAYATTYRDLPIRAHMRLAEVLRITRAMTFGGTDCRIPITEAIRTRTKVDAFVNYTDNEIWSSRRLGVQDDTVDAALTRYRHASGIPARNVVCATALNDFSIANVADPLQLDVAGFDAAVPQIISDFIDGRV